MQTVWYLLLEVYYHEVLFTPSSSLFPFTDFVLPIFFIISSCFLLCLLYHVALLFLTFCLHGLPPSHLTPSSPLPSLCAPLFPPSHQSLALASPSRTYGMMDRRASGASKARGHLPGAPHCRGSQGPTMQPRPRTSVSRHARTQHSRSYCAGAKLTLAPLTLAAAFVPRQAVWIFTDAVRSSDKKIKKAVKNLIKRWLCWCN